MPMIIYLVGKLYYPAQTLGCAQLNYETLMLGRGDGAKFNRLSLNEKETEEFIGERLVKFEAMEKTLLNLWRPIKGACIKSMGGNGLYLFQFFHKVDLRKMIAGGPRSFNNCLLLIHHLREGKNLDDIEFHAVDFWVRVHDLSLGFASEMLARNIGNLMGKLLDYDSSPRRSSMMNYMRIRVRLDITEPLMRTKRIRKEGGNHFEVSFSYEWVPLLCYLCGIIAQRLQSCRRRSFTGDGKRTSALRFGPKIEAVQINGAEIRPRKGTLDFVPLIKEFK
ncbi:hypothetical protein K2173_013126 [Erythroxylum novogranatense]|uniref:DUF4283 domain-containing protein n=1 Tax=Erythroxylum novogranatense TaxID=1862640 RepID=A0AAV8S597_9ROSI|nr:hypothetical protein K2173_013126 [Erythroxylum novogranatense]